MTTDRYAMPEESIYRIIRFHATRPSRTIRLRPSALLLL